MKCSACDDELCGRLYENRNKCTGKKEGITCTCKCRVTEFADAFTKTASFVGGAACIGGGIFVGALVPPVRGFCIGAGSSLMSKPFRKEMNGEHLEFDDSVGEALTFGAIGASIGSGIALANGAVTATEISTAVVTLTGAVLAGAQSIKCNKT
ncbi:hypothetical protein ACKWTF_016151 [Chironomus riparius]